MSMNEILDAVMRMSNSELNLLYSAAKVRRSSLSALEVCTISVGQRVTFAINRRGTMVEGTVRKVNQKTVTVEQDSPKSADPYLYRTKMWRVPGASLTRI